MPPHHRHEQDRLESLRSYAVLDTAPEAPYDAITELAARLCDAPIALVSLSADGRQFFKSRYGTDLAGAPAGASFCPYVVGPASPLVVRDAQRDPRFAGLPVVAGELGLRAYAGVPLIGRDGLPVGTLCVFDTQPRDFHADQVGALATLADHVMHLLELRRVDASTGRLPRPAHAALHEPRRLRRALDDGELVPHFQPLVELSTGRAAGLEALLRWHHPDLGVVPPAAFLPVVESSGLMMPVGRRVLAESLRVLAALDADPAQPALVGMAVNVSLVQLAEPGLSTTVLAELDRHGLAPGRLSLELTETAALLDDRVALDELRALREAGVHLALDDYGTGWSSLTRLLDLPLSALKLDRSLVQRLPHDARALSVVEATLGLCEALGLGVVAEGIETPDQHEALAALGCAYGQGYLFSRAVAPDALPGVLAGWVARSAVPLLVPLPRG